MAPDIRALWYVQAGKWSHAPDLISFCSLLSSSCCCEEAAWPGLEASSPGDKGLTHPEEGSQAFTWCYDTNVNGALQTTATVGMCPWG